MLAGSSSVSSANVQTSNGVDSAIDSLPSTSSYATNTGGQYITSSALNNALQNAFRDANSSVAQPSQQTDESLASTESAPPRAAVISGEWVEQYASELVLMREMGLMDEARNVQMLALCGGDVAQAINLMLSESI